MKTKINRLLYLLFIIVGVSSLIMQMYMTTISLLGLSILFDPFDANQSWREKPFWQKAVFITQGTIVIGLFIPLMYNLWNSW
jgi:cytochrome b561